MMSGPKEQAFSVNRARERAGFDPLPPGFAEAWFTPLISGRPSLWTRIVRRLRAYGP